MEQPSESLATKTVSGATWAAIARAGQQGVLLLSSLVLARLLSPSAYGLLGMAAVVIGFITIFKDMGTSSALVQRKELTENLICSVFWANCLFGLVATLVVAGISPAVAIFYREPQIMIVLAVLSTSFFLSALSTVPQALMIRAMSFHRLAAAELGSSAAAAVTAITVAILGAGVWSLVALTLTTAAMSTLILWLVSPWRPRWHFSSRELRHIASYSLNLTTSDTLAYFTRNADNVLIGRYLGAIALGFYSLAYTLMLYPLQNISWVLSRVLFSLLSKVQDDNALFGEAYLRVCAVIAAVTFPLMLGLLVTAEPLIGAALGSKWLPVVPLVMILAPVGMVQSVGTTVGDIYMAKGRTDWMLRWSLGYGALVITSFAVGLRWGAIGVASSYGLVTFALMYPSFAIPFRLIHLPVRKLALAVWPQLLFSLAMAAVVLLFRLGISRLGISQPLIVAPSAVLLGAATYLVLMLWRNPPVWKDLLLLLPSDRRPSLARAAFKAGLDD